MNIDPNTTKYLIKATLTAEGVVDKPDIIGAIFGQTEGLLGDELDLRDLQKSGRMGRLEVTANTVKGRTESLVIIPSSLDQVETSIFAASLETVERVGPCKASIKVEAIEDVRMLKRTHIIDRAKELLGDILLESRNAGATITDSVRQMLQTEEITSYGDGRIPAGPNVATSDAIIIVEGRSDVLNLLRYGIKNAVAVEGTSAPQAIQELSRERTVTAFVDGDRGGELVLRELLQNCEVDFVARAPPSKEVEDLTQKQIMKCLRDKMPKDQFLELTRFNGNSPERDSNRGGRGKDNRKSGRRQDASSSRDGKGRGDSGVKPAKPSPKPADKAKDDKRDQKPEPAKASPKMAEKAKDDKGDQKPEPAKAKPEPKVEAKKEAKKEVQASPSGLEWEAAGTYRNMLKELDKSRKARLLNAKNEVMEEVAISALTETLQNATEAVATVIFDGIITQRLIDISTAKDVKTLVAVKVGPITKRPVGMKIFDKNQL